MQLKCTREKSVIDFAVEFNSEVTRETGGEKMMDNVQKLTTIKKWKLY